MLWFLSNSSHIYFFFTLIDASILPTLLCNGSRTSHNGLPKPCITQTSSIYQRLHQHHLPRRDVFNAINCLTPYSLHKQINFQLYQEIVGKDLIHMSHYNFFLQLNQNCLIILSIWCYWYWSDPTSSPHISKRLFAIWD
jgi:hypothetical protein